MGGSHADASRVVGAGAVLMPFAVALALGALALADGVVLTLDEGLVVEPTSFGSAVSALAVVSLAVGFAAVRAYTARLGEPPWVTLFR